MSMRFKVYVHKALNSNEITVRTKFWWFIKCTTEIYFASGQDPIQATSFQAGRDLLTGGSGSLPAPLLSVLQLPTYERKVT